MEEISDYLLTRKEIDGLPAAANKSMAAFNYVDSGWVSRNKFLDLIIFLIRIL
jgi:hypothetical protein